MTKPTLNLKPEDSQLTLLNMRKSLIMNTNLTDLTQTHMQLCNRI